MENEGFKCPKRCLSLCHRMFTKKLQHLIFIFKAAFLFYFVLFVCLLCFHQLFKIFHEHAFHRHWSFVVVNLFFAKRFSQNNFSSVSPVRRS